MTSKQRQETVFTIILAFVMLMLGGGLMYWSIDAGLWHWLF